MIKITNNAQAALVTGGSDLAIGSTSFDVTANLGQKFPSLGADDITFVRFGGNNLFEIVKITSRTVDAFVCEPTNKVWANGTNIDIVPSEQIHAQYLQKRLSNYSEHKQSGAISSGVLTLDLSQGNCFDVSLTEDITAITITNVQAGHHAFTLYTTQDATGGRTIDFTGMHAAGGTAPTISSDASAKDGFTLTTRDSGAVWEVYQYGTDVKVIA